MKKPIVHWIYRSWLGSWLGCHVGTRAKDTSSDPEKVTCKNCLKTVVKIMKDKLAGGSIAS